ncbi:DUF2871 family protein [Paenibacillus macerans]|uniref:DUF2871 family protein n=1 Tax=Paenibacillus macerans TaxID=44252 RepID=UPI003D3194B7
MKKLYYTSFFYALLGLLAGIFYREVTKPSTTDLPAKRCLAHCIRIFWRWAFCSS